MAEEVKDAPRNVPRGILGALAASTLLYVVVTAAVVMADRDSASPLLSLFEGRGATTFATIGAIAISNGVLAEILMLARLFYGMARNGQLPAALGSVHPRTQTPIPATIAAGALVLATALLLPFEYLLVLANVVTLCVFVAVDLALWRVKLRDACRVTGFAAPRWVPPLAAAAALVLIFAELFQGQREPVELTSPKTIMNRRLSRMSHRGACATAHCLQFSASQRCRPPYWSPRWEPSSPI
jgi:amino acid transporter